MLTLLIINALNKMGVFEKVFSIFGLDFEAFVTTWGPTLKKAQFAVAPVALTILITKLI